MARQSASSVAAPRAARRQDCVRQMEPETDPGSDPQAGAGAQGPGNGLASRLSHIPVKTCPGPGKQRKAPQRPWALPIALQNTS